MEEPLKPLLSASDVAKLLRVSRITVYRYTKSGKLKPIKLGNKLRFEQDVVQAFLVAG